MDAPLTPERLSDLIGAIYDCAIEPDRWPQTMGEICSELQCLYSAIILLDLELSRHRFLTTWNTPENWMSRRETYNQDVTLIWTSTQNTRPRLLDEPTALSREPSRGTWESTRYYREWAKPQGLCDTIFTVVLREPRRAGIFSAVRHEAVGCATDREIAILRLLAPHVRRAVTIGDLIDFKGIEIQALAAALDSFSLGVILVGEGGRILHANAEARNMFAAGVPVRSVNGRLSVRDAAADAELARVIALARREEAGIGAAGIGVALKNRVGEPAVAHVLPLAHGDLRTRLVPRATAAVFVMRAGGQPVLDAATIAGAFGLTPRETQLLRQLAAGASLPEAAAALGIAETTAKTHLGNIFGKTGVARQANLIALVHRLSPPLGRSGQG